MSLINKQDTEGTKGLLIKGEFGYDDYTAGGDTGRVYIGTGTVNIALAQKSEVDANATAISNHVGSGGASHSLATITVAGFMSSTNKAKLDGIEASANNYSLPATIVSETDYATSATGGTLKARLDGTTLYLTNDGTDA